VRSFTLRMLILSEFEMFCANWNLDFVGIGLNDSGHLAPSWFAIAQFWC